VSVLLIHPNITIQQSTEAEQFYETLRDELEQHIQVVPIRSEALLKSSTPKHEDAIVVFNRGDQNYGENLTVLLAKAKEAQCEIVAVAISKEMRTPPTIIREYQSFDIHEYLENRCLSQDYIGVAAVVLARTIISKLQPTLSTDQMQLFLSYRRLDGEKLARDFHQQLQKRFEQGFRDLINIRTGEEAQEVIEENLQKSDAIIFLDTPKSGDSPWIAREIAIALSLNIPIVWIRVGNDDERVKLSVKPADKPHFCLPEPALKDEEIDRTFIDQVVRKTFEICRENATGVFDHLRRIESFRENQVSLIERDKKHMVYEVQIPRPSFRYPQKPISHLIQFYGRRPQDRDCEVLLERARSLGYQPEQYDAAILLGTAPTQSPECKECLYIDSSNEYVATLERHFTSNKAENQCKGLIISGAFPDCEPQYQQYITDAVHAFAQVTFDRSGIVIFGGHPTFQHLIFDMARRRRSNDFLEATHLYVTQLYVTHGMAEDFRKKATTVVTDKIDEDQAKSLTVMRRTMISEPSAVGMVVIGGKTDDGGHSPGVDEEIELAKQTGLPIFLIGSVGGRSAYLAMEMDKKDWKEPLNGLSTQQNKQLMLSTDYATLANMALKSIGF
jgi:hypothetical protein